MADLNTGEAPSERDRRFIERQIRVHVDIAQWKPHPYALTATPEAWRRAFAIASLRRGGVTDSAEIGRRLGTGAQEVDDDSRLIPYLDRTIAGLLSVLGWHFDSQI